jgi:HEAT repeat protein
MTRKVTRIQSQKKHTTVAPKAAAKPAPKTAPAAVVKAIEPAPTPVASVPVVAAEQATPQAASSTTDVEPTVSVQSLIQSLRDPSADVARDAAIELGRSNDLSAVLPLIEVIANTDGYYHNVVRAAAAEALGLLGDSRAVEPLLVLSRDTMAEASAEAVRALALLNDQRAVAPLIDIVRNSYGFFLPIVRRAAVIALAKLGGPEAIAELQFVSRNTSEDPVIRQAATRAIA